MCKGHAQGRNSPPARPLTDPSTHPSIRPSVQTCAELPQLPGPGSTLWEFIDEAAATFTASHRRPTRGDDMWMKKGPAAELDCGGSARASGQPASASPASPAQMRVSEGTTPEGCRRWERRAGLAAPLPLAHGALRCATWKWSSHPILLTAQELVRCPVGSLT